MFLLVLLLCATSNAFTVPGKGTPAPPPSPTAARATHIHADAPSAAAHKQYLAALALFDKDADGAAVMLEEALKADPNVYY